MGFFDKLKKVVSNVASDVTKSVTGQADGTTNNHIYEATRDATFEYYAAMEVICGTVRRAWLVDLPKDRGLVDNPKTTEVALEQLTELLNKEFELCKKLNRPFPKASTREEARKIAGQFVDLVTIYAKA